LKHISYGTLEKEKKEESHSQDLDYQITVTQLKEKKGNGDMQAAKRVEMRHLPLISIYGYVGGRQISGKSKFTESKCEISILYLGY